MAQLRNQIASFSASLGKCQAANALSRDSLLSSVKDHSKAAKHQQEFYALMTQFEGAAIAYFSDHDPAQLMLTHPNKAGDLNERLQQSTAGARSPFREAAVWIRGEMLDIQGMQNAFKTADTVVRRGQETESRRRSEIEELEKMQLGKTTLKSFFKSKEGKDQEIKALTKSIATGAFFVEEYRKLAEFVTVYQAQAAIPQFKRDKVRQYERMLLAMSAQSICNAHLQAQLSTQILALRE